MRYGAFILIPLCLAFLFAIISHFALGDEIKGARSFSDHLYFSTVTMTSVGYGDMVPQTPRAKLFVTAYIILAYTAIVYVAGTML